MKNFIILSFLISTSCFAAGDHFSPGFFAIQVFNFGLLFGFIIYKVKGPLKNYFVSKSEDIENGIEKAKIKDKESLYKYENIQKKLKAKEDAGAKIIDEARNAITLLENQSTKEMENRVQKIKDDAISSAEAEKNQGYRRVNKELVEKVISKTKGIINKNDGYKSKISTKLINQIQN